jgi:hypothetical protein
MKSGACATNESAALNQGDSKEGHGGEPGECGMGVANQVGPRDAVRV